MKHKKKFSIGDAVSHVYLILLSIIAVFPLLWILICSVKGKGELTGNPTSFLPKTFTLEYYRHVIQDLNFAHNIGNSVLISLCTTAIAITISAMAAYGVVRFFRSLEML